MAWAEFFAELGVNADILTVKKFVSALGEVPLTAAAAITALAGIEYGFMNMTSNALDAAMGFKTFGYETGMSAGMLQRWTFASQQLGASAGSAKSAIMGIQSAIAQAELGNPAALGAFARLGVNFREKDPFKILEQLAANYGRYDAGKERILLGQISVPADMMGILAASYKQRQDLLSRAPAMNEGEIESFAKMKNELSELARVVSRDFNPVLEQLIPAMKKFAVVIAELLKTIGPFLLHTATGVASNFQAVANGDFGRKFHENLRNEFSLPKLPTLGAETGMMSNPELNLVQHIYSTSDPEEVARFSTNYVKRSILSATKNSFNGGY